MMNILQEILHNKAICFLICLQKHKLLKYHSKILSLYKKILINKLWYVFTLKKTSELSLFLCNFYKNVHIHSKSDKSFYTLKTKNYNIQLYTLSLI